MSRHRTAWKALIDKHWGGDEDAMKEWFTHIGRMATDPVPQNGAWNSWEPVRPIPEYAKKALRRFQRKAQGEE